MLTLSKRSRLFPSIWEDFFNEEWMDNRSVSNTLPAVNVKENADNFSLELAAPGLKKEDFKIKLENDLLTISRAHEEKNEETDEKGNYTRREFFYSAFSRSFRLPETVDGEKIDAKYIDGVLHLTLPKKEEAVEKGPREIAIS
jgi:HSP20 family protein